VAASGGGVLRTEPPYTPLFTHSNKFKNPPMHQYLLNARHPPLYLEPLQWLPQAGGGDENEHSTDVKPPPSPLYTPRVCMRLLRTSFRPTLNLLLLLPINTPRVFMRGVFRTSTRPTVKLLVLLRIFRASV